MEEYRIKIGINKVNALYYMLRKFILKEYYYGNF